MAGRYAESTAVPADRSRSEIERTLVRYGADSFAYGWDRGRSVITFRASDRWVRLTLTLPARTEFTRTPTGRSRSTAQVDAEWERAQRQSWRALALVVKAKLEAVAAGIATFEAEFLAYVVLPDGETVGEHIAPEIDRVYETGVLTGGLLALGPGGDRG